VAERPSVTEVIQADIDLILAKIESLKDLLRHQFETKISWTRLAALKDNKSTKKQKVADPFQITPNRYNLLGNDTNDDDDDDDDTPSNTGRLSELTTNHIRRDTKKNYKKSSVKSKAHKVLILGDSHARRCASEVKQQLNNEYEVFGFINPGSGMKDIKESAEMKMAQLTRENIVVLWRGSYGVARNNSMVGMEHILYLLTNSTHTNVILLSVLHKHDLIKGLCVNREVESLIASQAKTINRFRNLPTKVAKCSANIYFNRQCLKNNIIPKYAKVKVPNTSTASHHTTQKAKIMRIKDELKFLHKKKETLNRELYRCHLQAAQEWGKYWNCIRECIIHRDMEKKYKSMDDKIRLIQNTTRKQRTDVSFYHRVINNTNIEFSEEELHLLNKGLKYN